MIILRIHWKSVTQSVGGISREMERNKLPNYFQKRNSPTENQLPH